jgi:hypothetical protein
VIDLVVCKFFAVSFFIIVILFPLALSLGPAEEQALHSYVCLTILLATSSSRKTIFAVLDHSLRAAVAW